MASPYTKDLMQAEITTFGYQVGEHSYGQPNVLNWGEGSKLVIGKYCSIAGGCTMFLGGNHRTDWVTTYPFSAMHDTWPEAEGIEGHPQSKGDVVVGNDVWLGAYSTIMSGVTIGDGAVVGAYAVVAKNVPAYAIVGGNPAKLIRYRFDEETRRRLLTVKWWDWPEQQLRQAVPSLVSGDIEKFLQIAEAVVGERARPSSPAPVARSPANGAPVSWRWATP